MFVSMSRTIGNSMLREACSKRGTGPMSIIWWTAGVSGMLAPAMRASFGLQTPQAMTTVSDVDVSLGRTDLPHAAALDVDPENLDAGSDRQRTVGRRLLAHERPRA